MGRGGIVV